MANYTLRIKNKEQSEDRMMQLGNYKNGRKSDGRKENGSAEERTKDGGR